MGSSATVANESAAVADETVKAQVEGQSPEVEDEDEDEAVTMLQFVEAWETSIIDGTGIEGCAAKTGLKAATCQAKASKFRNPQYKEINKVLDGKAVYKRAKVGDGGETETTDEALAKVNSQGKKVHVKVFALDAGGNKILQRKGISLSNATSAATSRVANQVDEAEALLARLRGEAAKKLQA